MATIIHNQFRNGLLGGGSHGPVDFDADTIKASLLDATDAGTITAAFEDYDEVDTPTVVAVSSAMASVTIGTVAVGVVDFADFTFTAVSGDAADYLTFWKDSGTPATSPLIVTYDSATSGLPLTPNGGDVDVTMNASGFVAV